MLRKLLQPLLTLVLVLGALALQFTMPVSASAATPSARTSETINGRTLRSFTVDGLIALCIDDSKVAGGYSGATTVSGTSSAIAGLSTTASRRLSYLANRANSAPTRPTTVHASTNYAMAAYRIVGSKVFMTWWNASIIKGAISAARVAEVNALVNETNGYGISRVSVTAGQVLPGQLSSGSVAVYAVNGTPVPRATLSTTGVSISFNSRATTTDANGKGAFTFMRTLPTAVSFTSTASRPSAYTVRVTTPYSSSYQRFIYGNFVQSAKGGYSYQKLAGLASVTSSCSTDCDGNAMITMSYCAPSGMYRTIVLIYLTDTNAVIGRLDLAPGACGMVKFPAHDAMRLRMKHFNSTQGGTYLAGTTVIDNWAQEVVCPAWAKGTITVSANCTECTASVGFTTPANTRFYTGRLELGNSAGTLMTLNYNLVNGTSQTFALKDASGNSIKVVPGTVMTLKFTAYYDAAHTRPIASAQNKVLVSIQVLDTAGTALTYKVTQVSGGAVHTSTVTK